MYVLKKFGSVFMLLLLVGCMQTYQLRPLDSLVTAAFYGDLEQVRALLKMNFNVNERGPLAITPLMAAARKNNRSIILLLLAHHADPKLYDHNHHSALWYAYEYNCFDAFRVLVEKGLKIDFSINAKNTKKNFVRFYQEFNLYQVILNQPDIKLLDQYFSIFPDGYYFAKVATRLQTILAHDCKTAAPAKFIKKYNHFGHNGYLIIANSLNIRKYPDAGSLKIGIYHKGDKVYGINLKKDWLRTKRGWISKTYTRRLTRVFPEISKCLKTAAHTLKSPEKVIQPKAVKPRLVRKKAVKSNAEQELEQILKKPTIEALEIFIPKYKRKYKYKKIVKKAKQVYQKLLLGD